MATTLNQLGATLINKMIQIEEHNTSLALVASQNSKDSQQLCSSIKSNQSEFVEIMQKLQSIQIETKQKLSPEANPDVALTPLQQANIERSLFYLQQISDFFRVKFQKSVFSSSIDLLKGGNGLSVKQSMTHRKSLHSVRSEMILKRISRELLQPIREQYNTLYEKNCELQQQAMQLITEQRVQQTLNSKSQTVLKKTDRKQRSDFVRPTMKVKPIETPVVRKILA